MFFAYLYLGSSDRTAKGIPNVLVSSQRYAEKTKMSLYFVMEWAQLFTGH